MKKNVVYLFIPIAAMLLQACHPEKVRTERFQMDRTYQLTEDSTKGRLTADISVDLPIAFSNEDVLQMVRYDIITQTFGEKYADCSNEELLPRFIEDMYQDYMAENQPYLSQTDIDEIGFSFNNEYMLETTVRLNDGHIFAQITDRYAYTGGAHGLREFICANYDMTDGHRITEKDLFNDGYEKPLTELLLSTIETNLAKDSTGHSLSDYWTDNIAPNGNFCITATGLQYVFNPYEIAPYYLGHTTVELPFGKLKAWMKKESPVNYLIQH